MKLQYADLPEISKLSDDVLKQKLLNSYAARKQINDELAWDSEINELKNKLEELKAPYKKRLLRVNGIIKSCELIAGTRQLAIPQEDSV